MKQDEAMYLQQTVACEDTTRSIAKIFGPITDEEIDFYIKELKKNEGEVYNKFQKELIFNLFYKYYRDTMTIKGINQRDYIMLMIAAKRMLINNGMIFLPYIIGGKCVKITTRKSINKKEMMKLEISKFYNEVLKKYNYNKSIIEIIENKIATILSSEFIIIDYFRPELNGQPVPIVSEAISEEFLLYTTMI
jgi:hypothetical protein